MLSCGPPGRSGPLAFLVMRRIWQGSEALSVKEARFEYEMDDCRTFLKANSRRRSSPARVFVVFALLGLLIAVGLPWIEAVLEGKRLPRLSADTWYAFAAPMAVVVLAALALRWWTARSNLHQMQRFGPVHVTIKDGGLRVRRNSLDATHSWSGFTAIEQQDGSALFWNQNTAVLVPKRAFSDTHSFNDFVNEVRARVQKAQAY